MAPSNRFNADPDAERGDDGSDPDDGVPGRQVDAGDAERGAQPDRDQDNPSRKW